MDIEILADQWYDDDEDMDRCDISIEFDGNCFLSLYDEFSEYELNIQEVMIDNKLVDLNLNNNYIYNDIQYGKIKIIGIDMG